MMTCDIINKNNLQKGIDMFGLNTSQLDRQTDRLAPFFCNIDFYDWQAYLPDG